MTTWLLVARPRGDEARERGRALTDEALLALGEEGGAIAAVDAETIYEVDLEDDTGDVDDATVDIFRRLFSDPVAETFHAGPRADGALPPPPEAAESAPVRTVIVRRRAGVMDPPALSAVEALRDLGVAATDVRIARRYFVRGTATGGALSDEAIGRLARRALASDVVDEIVIDAATLPARPPAGDASAPGSRRREVAVRELDDEALAALSRDHLLALDVHEMRAVAAHFRKLEREPSDVELETVAQTWSEHCKHKTFRGVIEHVTEDADGVELDRRTIDDLLGRTIVDATTAVTSGEDGRDDCVSLFADNAGVVRFDERLDVCAKVETHNHPSAIEPYGGSETGVGGVIRDILGTGQGAWPILNIDVFCLGPPDLPADELPEGSLHPRRVLAGVVAGVRDYGNRMGIPTASGALIFDRGYVGNPLVFVGTIGVIPRGRSEKGARPGDRIIAAGGRTGRDGIHGATFSSLELTSESETMSGGAVQIGNPIEEKKVADVIEAARDADLVHSVTDCGAGGFSSAVGEMAEEIGAVVDLERAPLKYPGLTPAEVWISEAQERMVFACPPDRVGELRALFDAAGVETTDLGRFGADDRALVVRWEGEELLRLGPEFLHDGLPRTRKHARTVVPTLAPASETLAQLDAGGEPLGAELRAILGDLDVASKEWVTRQYDHEVQGLTALRPCAGPRAVGPQDAVAVVPRPRSTLANEAKAPAAVVVGLGLCPSYGELDPHAMAMAAVDEALRNVVAAGGDPRRTSLLDNFCWGDPNDPDILGALVRTSEGAADAARLFGCPYISGKDSLNNTYRTAQGERVSIPGTLLVTAVGVVDDAARLVSMEPKAAGEKLYLVGVTRAELGGSKIAGIRALTRAAPPRVTDRAPIVLGAIANATAARLVRGAHDLSEGGLAVAAAELGIGADLTITVDLAKVPWDGGGAAATDRALAFAESTTRLLLSVDPDDAARLEETLTGAGLQAGRDFAAVGEVVAAGEPGPRLTVTGLAGDAVIDEPIDELREHWRAPLYRVFGQQPPTPTPLGG